MGLSGSRPFKSGCVVGLAVPIGTRHARQVNPAGLTEGQTA